MKTELTHFGQNWYCWRASSRRWYRHDSEFVYNTWSNWLRPDRGPSNSQYCDVLVAVRLAKLFGIREFWRNMRAVNFVWYNFTHLWLFMIFWTSKHTCTQWLNVVKIKIKTLNREVTILSDLKLNTTFMSHKFTMF